MKGDLLESTDYRPFGEQRYAPGVSLTPYQYTDQEWEANTGLYNYDARLYDPVLGRFIAPDSIIPGVYSPQALNPYVYCLNNPLIYVDPSGNISLETFDYQLPSCMDQFHLQAHGLAQAFMEDVRAGRYLTAGMDGLLLGANTVGYGPMAAATDMVITHPFNSGINFWNSSVQGDLGGAVSYGTMILANIVFNRMMPKPVGNVETSSGTITPVSVSDDVATSANGTSGSLRVRHHTSSQGLNGIKNDAAINPARGEPIGVHVELEAFGPVRTASAETGAFGKGAYVEFNAPSKMVMTNVGPRNTAIIPANKPLSIKDLNPTYKKSSWWKFWEY